jgi:uncharacterized Zn ribbon protein
MGFEFVMKKCRKCGCDFVASDESMNYCDECYLEEFEPFDGPEEY